VLTAPQLGKGLTTMFMRCVLVAVSLTAIADGSPSFGASPDAEAASEALADLRSCDVSDLPPLLDLIKKYRMSDDIDTKVVVAEAESRIAFVYQYQSMRPEAELSLRQIVKKYESQSDERLQAEAAQARVELSGLERDNQRKREDVDPVIARYKASKSLTLLYWYAQALEVVAGTERGTEKDDEGRQLSEEAHEVLYAVEKQRPPVTDEISVNNLCM
jgi:hypothetical protein